MTFHFRYGNLTSRRRRKFQDYNRFSSQTKRPYYHCSRKWIGLKLNEIGGLPIHRIMNVRQHMAAQVHVLHRGPTPQKAPNKGSENHLVTVYSLGLKRVVYEITRLQTRPIARDHAAIREHHRIVCDMFKEGDIVTAGKISRFVFIHLITLQGAIAIRNKAVSPPQIPQQCPQRLFCTRVWSKYVSTNRAKYREKPEPHRIFTIDQPVHHNKSHSHKSKGKSIRINNRNGTNSTKRQLNPINSDYGKRHVVLVLAARRD
ncbi:hypothetical protein Y032_0438g1479 [Ancylostoma ceylanicum]|uniref:Uncharacterized protein n=1 Tax=Ancylostoma ceylanicum TaxID=53326 RepID=A0A016WZW0_9BILA|nr:hypothetical protein Y032_0438g1479 [Ancylostoma ceylanicum]